MSNSVLHERERDRARRSSRLPRAAWLRRSRRVTLALASALLLISIASLMLGAISLSVPEILATMVGRGDRLGAFVIGELRLPRLAAAILTGIAFALGGSIFQLVLANPLASPDIIGVTSGASVGAVAATLVFGLSGPAVGLSALGGALLVAGLIFVLSGRSARVGYRFVLVGIGLAFMANALLGYLLTRADVREAQSALVWLVGSVAGVTWGEISVLAAALALLIPVLASLVPRLQLLQLGEDTAHGLGVPVGATKGILLLTGVILAAGATAIAGPIAFVAFAAGPVARRLVGTGGLALVPSAAVGAVLVAGSDLIAQHLVPGGTQVPVGIVTGVLAGPFLLWLIGNEKRATAQ